MAKKTTKSAKKAPARKPPKKPAAATLKRRRERVNAILPVLDAEHPDAKCSLDFTSPLELAVATILSAQCTDARVNLTTPKLFKAFPNAATYVEAGPEAIEPYIKSCGFFRAKSKSIYNMAKSVVDDFDGEVPRTMNELVKLAGIGRKTANVVLGNAFNINEGMAVDTHVTRLANRLGLTKHPSDAVKIERDLLLIVPQEEWTQFSHLLIFHGRRVCKAQSPACDQCVIFKQCPSGKKILAKREKAKK